MSRHQHIHRKPSAPVRIRAAFAVIVEHPTTPYHIVAALMYEQLGPQAVQLHLRRPLPHSCGRGRRSGSRLLKPGPAFSRASRALASCFRAESLEALGTLPAQPGRESIYGVRVWLGLFFGHLQVSKYFITAHSNRRFRRFRESLRISKSQADCTKVASRCSEFISCIQTFVCAKAQSARGHFQRLCLPFPDPSLPLGHPLRTPVPSIPTVPALSGRAARQKF